jgi:ActR/RegA family two-component response regulator
MSELKLKQNRKSLSNSKKTDDESMEDVERKHIQKVLESCEGNRTHAAKKAWLEC